MLTANQKRLPQICIKCRQMKTPDLGKFSKSRLKHNKLNFTCDQCLSNQDEKVVRIKRPFKESRPEAIVRTLLSSVKNLECCAEYPIGKFIFDFAIPKIRLLIEVDSKTWHESYLKKRRDKAKNQIATEQHWRLVRLTNGPRLKRRVREIIESHASELGEIIVYKF